MIQLNYPKTIVEAVDILEHILLDIEKEGIMDMPEQGVIDLYLVYGRWIKNYLGLCDSNHELISDCKASEPYKQVSTLFTISITLILLIY